MEQDEKTLKVIELMHQNMKLVIEVVTKGMVFHLGFSAFSATFAFDRPSSARIAIMILNVALNFFAAASIILAVRALNKMRAKLITLYDQIGTDIGATAGRSSRLTWIPLFYAVFCALLAAFWIASFWLPSKESATVAQPQERVAASKP